MACRPRARWRAQEMLEEAGAASILSVVAVVKSHPQALF
jgi:hypothetical protein